MPLPDVERMLRLVEEKTGYPVTVSRSSEIATHSATRTASKDAPAHFIQIHPDSYAHNWLDEIVRDKPGGTPRLGECREFSGGFEGRLGRLFG